MVLAELGGRISRALNTMKNSTMLDDQVITDMLQEIQRALIEADVNIKLVFSLRENIKKSINLADGQAFNKRKIIQQSVVRELTNLLDPGSKPFQPSKKAKTNVIVFVGLQGSGKTTTVTKYALYYQKKGFKTGVVCADTFRAGAYDQLNQNAQKAGIKFFGKITETDPVVLADEGVKKFKSEGCEVIIVDTSGRHKQETALFDEMEQVVKAVSPNDIVFVLDSSIGQAAMAQATAFKERVNVGSVIITKLDGHAKGGGALSAVAATKAPITFIGTGEHFEDFEVFNPQSFVSRLLGFGDIDSLVDRIKIAGIDKSASITRITEGEFSLRDMQDHLNSVLKLGNISSFMDLMPGLPQGMFKGADGTGTQHLQVFITIMDSMNDKELDHPQPKKYFTPDRIMRIARGSGRHQMEVAELLKTHQKFDDMVKKIGKMKFKQLSKDPSALLRNNQLQHFANAIHPDVLRKMGGMGSLQNMIKQMSQNGNKLGL